MNACTPYIALDAESGHKVGGLTRAEEFCGFLDIRLADGWRYMRMAKMATLYFLEPYSFEIM
ncbi:MAG TPA: hypothetical protein DCZ41_02215 [Firmicutes bacterium]|nr:hypothetical protein [Bacillota bacterium]